MYLFYSLLLLPSTFLIATFWSGVPPSKLIKITTYNNLTNTENITWNGYAFGSGQPSIRRHKKTPKTLKEYQDEHSFLETSKKFFKKQDIKSKDFSILSSFLIHKQGIDYFEVQKFPKGSTHKIIGSPKSMSIWIHGYQQKHILYAHFYNQKDVLVKISNLNFLGWKRKEIILPSFLLTSPKKENQLQQEFTFIGFKIQTSKNEKSTLAIFHFSRICFLIKYPEVSEYDKGPF